MGEETDDTQFQQLMRAITDSREQMEAKFAKLRDDMSSSQEQATQEVVKTFKQQNEYSFKKKGNQIQFQFNSALEASLQVAKKELAKLELTEGQGNAALKRASESLEEGITAISDRQKKIKLADRSDYGWEMVSAYEKDELAENSDDERKIEKAEKAAEKAVTKRKRFRRDDRSISRGRGRSMGVRNQEGAPGHSAEATEARGTDVSERRIGPCFNCAGWGHLRRNCPRKAKLYPLKINTCLSSKSNLHGVDGNIPDKVIVSRDKVTDGWAAGSPEATEGGVFG